MSPAVLIGFPPAQPGWILCTAGQLGGPDVKYHVSVYTYVQLPILQCAVHSVMHAGEIRGKYGYTGKRV